MGEVAVKLEGIGKKYLIGHQSSESIKDSLGQGIKRLFGTKKKEIEEFWALSDISFEIKKGEALGIIGKNGAGKSTLLKILSRITHPTTGRFEINGRVSSLLEVGTGFHPELSGRENIFLNGTILGMTRTEIKSRFDEIVNFSGVEKFIDTPVKHYSSGMYVRLAFAVAAHLEPEILIIDEVLAVGDAEFQKKCLGKMDEVAKEGRTVIFVSHNMTAVRNLCSSGILLANGEQLIKKSNIEIILNNYQNQIFNSENNNLDFSKRTGKGAIYIDDIRINSGELNSDHPVVVGSPVKFELKYTSKSKVFTCQVIIGIYDFLGISCTRLDSSISGDTLSISEKTGKFECSVNELNLSPGKYYINIALFSQGELQDYLNQITILEIVNQDFFQSGKSFEQGHTKVWLKHTWKSNP